MSMINSEKTRKYSELHPVQIIENDSIFAVSQPDASQTLESKKVTFKQIKEQLDYDLNVVEIAETEPPLNIDLTYISLGGYKVPAYKYSDAPALIFPSEIPRMIPAISGFLVTKGIVYKVPFIAKNMILSDLTIESNTDYFSLLEVERVDDQNGLLTLISNHAATDEVFSVVRIKEQTNGQYLSFNIQHAYSVDALRYLSHTINGNVITSVWRGTFRNALIHANIQPSIKILESVNHTTTVGLNYFNQCKVSFYPSYYGSWNDMSVKTVLNQPYTGNLTIQIEDAVQGLSASTVLSVEYKG